MNSAFSDFKSFVSSSNHRGFKLLIPSEWDEYDDGEDDVYAFFNSASPEWTGNLRITHFIWTLPDTSEVDKGTQFVESQLKENPGSQRLQLGNFEAARYYKKTIGSDNDPLIIWYWTLGAPKDLFQCTFTAPNNDQATIQPSEFEVVERILSSIELIKE